MNVPAYHKVSRVRTRESARSPLTVTFRSGAKPVPRSPQRLNQLRLESVIDLSTHSRNENLECVREWIVVVIPDVSSDCGSIDNLPGVKNEELQESKFLCGQIDGLARARDPLRLDPNFQVCNSYDLRERRRPPARKRANSGDKLPEREWLGQIIVSTRVKARDAVVDRVSRGEHQYRRSYLPLAQVRAKVEAAAAGEHHVENDHVERIHDRLEPPLIICVGDHDSNFFFLEPAADDIRQTTVIFYKKNPHSLNVEVSVDSCGL